MAVQTTSASLWEETTPQVKPHAGPPMTLESAALAHVRLLVWCKACGHRSEPDPAEQARWYGPENASA